jgi:class 3 adenylate cyclase
LNESPPPGTLTFLFTDIENSTGHLHALGERYGELLQAHAGLIREAVALHRGREIDTQGDSFFLTFPRAGDAVAAAADIQRGHARHDWPDAVVVRVRLGIHTGEPNVASEVYFGLDIHRAARICALARGGETLISSVTASLVRDQLPADLGLSERGLQQLKGFSETMDVFALEIEGVEATQPGRPGADPEVREPFSGSYGLLARRVTQVDGRGSRPATLRILVVASSPERLERLVPFAELLAVACDAGITFACVCAPTSDLSVAPLAPVRRRLLARGIDARVTTFRSGRPGAAVEKLAKDDGSTVVVADGTELLDDSLHLARDLLLYTSMDVLLHVPNGEPAAARFVVPFSGAANDWAALQTSTLLARHLDARLVLLGVEADDSDSDDASRLLATASLLAQQLADTTPEPMLISPGPEAVLGELTADSHMVTGTPDDFESRGLGSTRLGILAAAPGAVTYVRSGSSGRDGYPSATRYDWTLTAGVRPASGKSLGSGAG